MRRLALSRGTLLSLTAAIACAAQSAMAGPLSDGAVAYAQGHYAEALQILRPLAEDGSPDAQMILGVMYQQGQGVPQSKLRAYVWFSQAMSIFNPSSGDFSNASISRDELVKSMTKTEVGGAEEAARRCQVSHYK